MSEEIFDTLETQMPANTFPADEILEKAKNLQQEHLNNSEKMHKIILELTTKADKYRSRAIEAEQKLEAKEEHIVQLKSVIEQQRHELLSVYKKLQAILKTSSFATAAAAAANTNN